MDIDALLMQSLQLLGLGMGAVFIILILLIVIISIVSKLVPPEVSVPTVIAPQGIDPAHIAAISAAVHQYRKNR
jgi:Na+-transporting methylmalonyl-CoA/oxaloacetate decarboxylase gamma subunit